MNRNQSIASYIAVFLVGLVLGVGATYTAAKKSLPMGISGDSYQAGFDAAKQRVIESGAGGILKAPDEIHNLSGTVTSVKGNTITLHARPLDPFEDASLSDRIITVTDDTKIVKISQKDLKALRSEMEANAQKMKDSEDSSNAPAIAEPFIKTDASLSDIAVGSTINIVATDNIKTEKKIAASEIQISPIQNISSLEAPAAQ